MIGAAKLAATGDWRQALYRGWVAVHRLDFAMVSLEELHLSPELSVLHGSSGGPDLERVFRALEIKPTDKIIDIGCGKGAAIITLAKFPFAKIAGVEISPALIRVAEANFARAALGRRRHDIKLHCCDAASFREYDEYNFVYFFNPFKTPVMKAVVENLGASLKRCPRRCTIVYKFPTCHDVLVSGGFEKIREFDHGPLPIAVYVNVERGGGGRR
jgi:SAM-dependent methyltransferase